MRVGSADGLKKNYQASQYHSLSIEALLTEFESSGAGLGEAQARANLATYGPNQLPKEKPEPIIVTIFHQLNNLLNYVLITAAVFSALTNHLIDLFVILLILFINTCIGLYHQLKARKIVQSLAHSFEQECVVLREGKTKKILTSELVPGDIIMLKEGEKIPADIRFISVHGVSCVESSLTGESKAVEKMIVSLPENTPLAQRINMGFAGTTLVTGEAKGLVVATGAHTQIGSIASSLQAIKEEKTLFEKRTDKLVKQMVLVTFSVSGLIFVIGLLRAMPLEDLILFVLATLISGIPEVLPTVLIVVLSIAALRMSRRKALLKKLAAIESLSTVTTIITDKTGTLTENTMSVQTIVLPDFRHISVTGTTWKPVGSFSIGTTTIDPKQDKMLWRLLTFAGFNDQADVIPGDMETDPWQNIGDPTEASRVALSRKAGFTAHDQQTHFSIVYSIPYDQNTKYRQTIVKENKTQALFLVLVGGAERIIDRSFSDQATQKKYHTIVEDFAAQAYRMQAVAVAQIDIPVEIITEITSGKSIDKKLLSLPSMNTKVELLGILAINDPIRSDVPDAVAKAQQAGVRVIMATGDHPATARAIGVATGIISLSTNAPSTTEQEFAGVLTEQEVEKMPDSLLLEKLKTITVFARMTPATKLRIASLLQKQGEVIAMTGDGTNDAPALKRADVGISMGRIGTDAAREASDLILLDDNFSTIVAAIEEGRTVFRNVRQASLFLLTTNFAEGLAMLVTMAAGFPLPLLPLQILWLNLVTDGVSGVALAAEKPQSTTLTSKPRKKTDGILSKKNLFFILGITLIMTSGTIGIFAYFMNVDIAYARTAAFLFLVFTNLFNMINLRSLDVPIFKLGLFSNRAVVVSFLLSCALVGLILYIPVLRNVFEFSTLSLGIIGLIFVASSSVFFAGEFLKRLHTID